VKIIGGYEAREKRYLSTIAIFLQFIANIS